jgi:hypothetical protein
MCLLLQDHQVLHLGLLLGCSSEHCCVNPCSGQSCSIHNTLMVVLLQGCLSVLLGFCNTAACSAT